MIRNTVRGALTVIALSLAMLASAFAQSPNTDTYFFTPGGGGVNGSVGMCLNTANPPRAVPCSNPGVAPNPTGQTPYPFNPVTAVQATPVTGNATGTTGAVVGTLAGAASKTTYICGFNVYAIGGTAAVGPITVAGLTGSSQVYQGSSSAAGGKVADASFNPCIPASAVNTAITITTTADGTATAVDVNSWGYQY
jgi:hypothetical protein